MYSSDYDHVLSILDEIYWGDGEYYNNIKFSNINNYLALGMLKDNQIIISIWDLNSKKEVRYFVIKQPNGPNNMDFTIRNCDYNIGNFLFQTNVTIEHPMFMNIGPFEFSKDDLLLISALNSSLNFYDLSTGEKLKTLSVSKGKIINLEVSNNGATILVGDVKGNIFVINGKQ